MLLLSSAETALFNLQHHSTLLTESFDHPATSGQWFKKKSISPIGDIGRESNLPKIPKPAGRLGLKSTSQLSVLQELKESTSMKVSCTCRSPCLPCPHLVGKPPRAIAICSSVMASGTLPKTTQGTTDIWNRFRWTWCCFVKWIICHWSICETHC